MRLTPPAVLLIQRPDTHFYPYQFYAAVYTAWADLFSCRNWDDIPFFVIRLPFYHKSG